MKTYHFAELTYRDINFDVAHKVVATQGFKEAIKLFNVIIEDRVKYQPVSVAKVEWVFKLKLVKNGLKKI